MALPTTGNMTGGTSLGAAGMGIIQFRYTEFERSVKKRCPAEIVGYMCRKLSRYFRTRNTYLGVICV